MPSSATFFSFCPPKLFTFGVLGFTRGHSEIYTGFCFSCTEAGEVTTVMLMMMGGKV